MEFLIHKIQRVLGESALEYNPRTIFCYRCMKVKYSDPLEAFSGNGSRFSDGRYHKKGEFLICYTSCSLQGAFWEYTNTAREAGFIVENLLPFNTSGAIARMGKIADLTNRNVRRRMKINATVLKERTWMNKSMETMTQRIGRIAFEVGLEGLLVPSKSGSVNFNIFPENLMSVSSIKIINESELMRG